MATNEYLLTQSLTNLTKGNMILQITPNTGYEYPTSLSVINGTIVSYDYTTGIAVVNGNSATIISGKCKLPTPSLHATVSGLGSEDPSDVSFTVDSGFTVAGIGIEQTEFNGDTFIKIPTLYRKVNTVVDNQITSFTVSTVKDDNSYLPYPCFVKEDGVTIMPYILIGKYWNTSASSFVSTWPGIPDTSSTMNLDTARTRAAARGVGYQSFDWMMQRLWQDLIIIFKRRVDTNSGYAWSYDDMDIRWEGDGCWVDGWTQNSGSLVVSYCPTKYTTGATSSTDGYTSISYSLPTTNGIEIQKLGYDPNNPFVNYPSAGIAGSNWDTYYCDAYYYRSGSYARFFDPAMGDVTCGAFECDGAYNPVYRFYVRLCYRPIA